MDLLLQPTYAPIFMQTNAMVKTKMRLGEMNNQMRWSKFIVPKMLNSLMTTYSYTLTSQTI